MVRCLRARVPAMTMPPNADRHVARVVVGCVQHALVQVELRVGEGARHGALRPGEHDGLGAVLDEIRQGCRGVCHGVGAVQHHEPVVVVVAFHYGAGDAQPVARAHVGRIDVHGLFHVECGEVATSGTYLVSSSPESARRPSHFPLLSSNGAACGDKQDAFLRHGCSPIFRCRARFWLLLDGRREQGDPSRCICSQAVLRARLCAVFEHGFLGLYLMASSHACRSPSMPLSVLDLRILLLNRIRASTHPWVPGL